MRTIFGRAREGSRSSVGRMGGMYHSWRCTAVPPHKRKARNRRRNRMAAASRRANR
jgi:hypothetical protein